MKSPHTLSVIAATLVFSVSLARGQEGPDPSAHARKIANWPAPAYWSPPAQPASVQEREGGVRREGVEALSTSPLPFIGITPCRVVDTRGNGFTGAYGPPALVGNGPARAFNIPAGPCPGIPAFASAYSINVAAILPASDGFMTVFPTGTAQPNSSDLNFLGGEVIANALIAQAGTGGAISVFVNVTTDMILDINGYYAPSGTDASNTFLGLNAGNFTMTGGGNTGLGQDALSNNTTGFLNTATGIQALWHNTTGNDNTATGWAALGENIAGAGNTAVGSGVLISNTMGSSNTATGTGALAFNTTGSHNIGVGTFSGSNLTTGDNNICIGNFGVAGESSTIRIGTVGTQTTAFVAGINGVAVTGVPVLVSGSGQLGVASSSRYVKEDIREIAGESDGLMRLRPVAFRYKPQIDPTGLAQYGLIAEEVADVYPYLVAYDRDGRPETVRYHLVNALVLNEVQKQHWTAEAQEKAIEAQEKTNGAQERTIEQQKAEIEGLKARLTSLEALLADSRP
jgi:Chaperone of endosialidase